MIERIPFGNTGHLSSRIIFGAAALGGMKPERAMATLELITAAGINHIDTAASYGDSELRLAPWLRAHRSSVFLATKTGQRSYAGAREELRRSLDRLGVPGVDLIQMHNLVDKTQWEQAFSEDGALRALIEARDEGLVRFIGVTGHGTYVAERHLQSLERFPFASVLCPYAFVMNRADLTLMTSKVSTAPVKRVALPYRPSSLSPHVAGGMKMKAVGSRGICR